MLMSKRQDLQPVVWSPLPLRGGRPGKAPVEAGRRLITHLPGAWCGPTTEHPGGLRADYQGLHKGDAATPQAEGQDKPRYSVLSEQLAVSQFPMDKRSFLRPSSLAGPLCRAPRGYTACSSQPLAVRLAKPHRFWQRDVQPDGQRLPLSLAGCFPEFLLQGNVFILWNSCSLKIKTEQEHKSSVCPPGLLCAIGQTGGTSCVIQNDTQRTVLDWQERAKSFNT